MSPLAWVLGLVLPACGVTGAGGLPRPGPLDVMRIERPGSPNTALAAPAGFRPTPDIETRVYNVPASRLYDAIRTVAQAAPRTFVAAEFPERHQSDYVVRSAIFNFPDLVTVVALDGPSQEATATRMPDHPGVGQGGVGQAGAVPASAGSSTLIVWSRSVYGRSDLGVNRARIRDWLAALDRRLAGA